MARWAIDVDGRRDYGRTASEFAAASAGSASSPEQQAPLDAWPAQVDAGREGGENERPADHAYDA